ncbi:MAG: DUF2993 domain-containing protein [Phormidesmis sp.]
MSSQDLDIGEKAISKAVEAGIKSQLDQVESIDVEIHTDPVKLAQGQVESALIKAKGTVLKNGLRTESLTMEIGSADIYATKVALGKIELEEPVDAAAQIVLKAEDIQAAFNSDFVKKKLRGTKVELPSGEKVTTDASNVSFTIPKAGRIALAADVMLIEKVETHHVEFSAVPQIIDNGHSVTLKEIEYDDATNDMPALTQSLIDSTEALLDLRNFELSNMSLKFDQLEIEPGQLMITAHANIQSFETD